jgi:hypothetical protein
MKLYGLMITKDDQEIFSDWCDDQLAIYDAVVCLDGSETDATEKIAAAHTDRLVYLHERDFTIPRKTDHGLRKIVHDEIVRRFGANNWVMCCHADEFCYHDPRLIAAKAQREGYDLVSWFTPHFYPHPRERADWSKSAGLPVPRRLRHYHWSYEGDGYPWLEDRLYLCGPAVYWDGATHGSVRPLGIKRPAPFHPILSHFKVYRIDPSDFEVSGKSSHYRRHWQGQEHRTGVAFEVRGEADLFVASVPKYACCDRFEGTFPHKWNIGEEYRLTEKPKQLKDPDGMRAEPDGSSAGALELADALGEALAQHEDVAEAWLHLGHALYSVGAMKEASRAWRRVLDLKPGHAGATVALQLTAHARDVSR